MRLVLYKCKTSSKESGWTVILFLSSWEETIENERLNDYLFPIARLKPEEEAIKHFLRKVKTSRTKTMTANHCFSRDLTRLTGSGRTKWCSVSVPDARVRVLVPKTCFSRYEDLHKRLVFFQHLGQIYRLEDYFVKT